MSNEIQAISQGNYILHNIDAKKLYVQEPLFTANSGDAVYVGWRPDETVLFEGNSTTDFTLSESPTAFEYLRLEYGAYSSGDNNVNVITTTVPAGIPNYGISYLFKSNPNSSATSDVYKSYAYYSGCSSTAWSKVYGTISQSPFTGISNNKGWTHMYKVVGINRKENA